VSLKSIYYKGNLSEGIQLEPSHAMFVIRFKTGVNEDIAMDELLANTGYRSLITLKASFKNSNVFIYTCNCPTDVLKEKIKQVIRGKCDERVIYVGTVLKFANTNIYQIYTENIFIKFKDHVREVTISKFLEEHGIKLKRKLNFGRNNYFTKLFESVGREIFEFCAKLLSYDIVEFCHPELVTRMNATNANLIDKGDNNSVLNKDWWLKRTKVLDSWQYSKGQKTTIAIIDDGIEANHPAFEGKIVCPVDMMDPKLSKFPLHKFDEGHGTACASIACSSDKKVYGVAPKAKIMPIRVTGLGSVLQSEAFFWAVNNGADVISCSWGSHDGSIFTDNDNNFNYPLPDHTRLAFEYAVKFGRQGKGCAIIFAAGNGKEPTMYDGYASSEHVLAVSSINLYDKPTVYSDYGEPVFCCFPSGDHEYDASRKPINKTGIYVADRIGKDGYSTPISQVHLPLALALQELFL
jgi:hypothetical protein